MPFLKRCMYVSLLIIYINKSENGINIPSTDHPPKRKTTKLIYTLSQKTGKKRALWRCLSWKKGKV